MLLEIRALCETLLAVGHRANKGLLVGMDPQMVKEVAPLLELLKTILALHQSSNSLCYWVLKSEYLEVLGVWNMSGSTDSMKGLIFFDAVLFSYN